MLAGSNVKAHLILSQVWSCFLWKGILCCQVRSGGETCRNECIFPAAVFKHNEVMESLPNLTVNIGMFCLSWTLSSCSWRLLSNWTSGDPYSPGDLLLEFLPDSNILLLPVLSYCFTTDFQLLPLLSPRKYQEVILYFNKNFYFFFSSFKWK